MGKISVFNQVTVDGYFADMNGDMSWAHKSDPEWNAFVQENASGEGSLLFGRVTYEMMASYWPTPEAMKDNPHVAKKMSEMTKIVFSRTLKQTSWENTRLFNSGLADEVRKLKKEPNHEITILGSGTIVSQLTQEGLIDEYQFVINPLLLGKGKSLFAGVQKQVPLKLTDTRSFKNGNVVLTYEHS
jgi:dihydrofolate reductase